MFLRAKLPEGAYQKTMLPGKTPAKNKTFDNCMSPSGLLEHLDIRFLNSFPNPFSVKLRI